MRDRITVFEKFLAGAAFIVAAALAFTALIINEEHELTAGVLMGTAQFLLLAASILHIDYKLGIFGNRNNS
jgi:hypothetical protein